VKKLLELISDVSGEFAALTSKRRFNARDDFLRARERLFYALYGLLRPREGLLYARDGLSRAQERLFYALHGLLRPREGFLYAFDSLLEFLLLRLPEIQASDDVIHIRHDLTSMIEKSGPMQIRISLWFILRSAPDGKAKRVSGWSRETGNDLRG
jgi:hypothetical protein